MCGFYKTSMAALQFDIDKEIDEIRFNHWIMKKENLQRVLADDPLEKGLFRMTVRTVEKDLSIPFSKARRLIKKFEELGIIQCVKASTSKKEASIYAYTTIYECDENAKKSDTVHDTVESTDKSSNCNASENVAKSVTETVNSTSKKENKKENKKDIYNRVVTRLNELAFTNFKYTTKKTQTLINSRMREGFSEEDFYNVIEVKAKEWKGTDFEKYLRPETLFGTKFENYLQQYEKDKKTPTAIGANKNKFDNNSICKNQFKNTPTVRFHNNF